MKTVEDVLNVARRNLGIVEGKNNDNPYAAVAGHANHQPWCASFVAAVLVRAGLAKPGELSAYCPTLYRQMTPVDRKDVRPGDVMFIYFPSLGRKAHTGIVEAVFAKYVVTIEGNTDVAGGRTGGKVMRKQRAFVNLSFARPKGYVASTGRSKPPVRVDPIVAMGAHGQRVLNIQRALVKHGIKVAMDGDFGPATRSAVMLFEKRNGLKVDGVAGQDVWNALREPA